MFQADEGVIDFLSAKLTEPDHQGFFMALRQVVTQTPGLGMTKVSEYTGLNRENLYRLLSVDGNPTISNLRQLLHGLGMDLTLVSYVPPPTDHTKDQQDKAGFRSKSLFDDSEGDDMFA